MYKRQVGEVYNNFYFSELADIDHIAEILQLYNNDIYLPANQETTLNAKYWIDEEIGEPINIFQLFSHAHRLNTEFKIFRINQDDPEYKELIYISYDWEHPPIMKFDPPMFLNLRDGIEMEATYNNYTDEVVEFGLLSIDEMMISFGLYFTGEQLANDKYDVLPGELSLHSNFPNPFNPITTIQYSLPEDGSVNIYIHDVAGRLVKTIVSSSQTSGYKSIQWDGTNNKNEPVAGGVYFYTLEQKELRQTKKMLLLK